MSAVVVSGWWAVLLLFTLGSVTFGLCVALVQAAMWMGERAGSRRSDAQGEDEWR